MFKICLSRFLQNKFYKIPKIIQNIEDFKIFDLYKNVSFTHILYVYVLNVTTQHILTSPSAYMVRLYVNVQFQVKPLSTGISSSRTKKFFWQKMIVWTPSRCVPSCKSLGPLQVKEI